MTTVRRLADHPITRFLIVGGLNTLVTGLLASALDARGLDVAVVKAVQTGCTELDGRIHAPDLAAVAPPATAMRSACRVTRAQPTVGAGASQGASSFQSW